MLEFVYKIQKIVIPRRRESSIKVVIPAQAGIQKAPDWHRNERKEFLLKRFKESNSALP